MIRLNFDIFSEVFCDLVAELKMSKVYVCCQDKPKLLAGAKCVAKLRAWHYLQLHRITDKHTI